MKKVCYICKKNKVPLLVWWFGLRHCEECDRKIQGWYEEP